MSSPPPDDPIDIADGGDVFEGEPAADGDYDEGAPMGKPKGSRDRQATRPGAEGDDDAPEGKAAGARDRQKKRPGLEDEGDPAPEGKAAGARDRQKKRPGLDEEDDA